MQVKKIAAVCALAFAGASAHAALTPAHQAVVDNAVSNGRVIYISGASAVQSGFTGIIAKTFTGTPIRFANTTASSKDYEAVAGTLAAGTGPWAGQNAIIIYRVKGGSVFGVNAVARAESIEALNVTSASCGAAGDGSTALPYTCTLNTRVPDAGVSDVAPALFVGPVNTEGEIAAESLTPTELAELTSNAIYGLAFGVPVTSNVGASVALNKATVSAIMTGNLADWSQVDSTQSGDIVICRRVPGSGTQAVENLFFGGFPCAAESNVPADRYISAAWNDDTRTYTVEDGIGGGAPIVIENSTSGDVRTCLNTAVTGGSYVTKDRDGNNVTVNFGAAGKKAIGVLSMDSLNSSLVAGNWQFRSLDGAGKITWAGTGVQPVTTGTGKFPTKASFTDGTWDLLGMISFNVPSRTTGNKAAVLAKFLENAQSPSVLYSVNNLRYVAGSPAGTADESVTKVAADGGGTGLSGNVMRASFPNGNQCAPYNRNN